jgi:hypothetical protein
VKILIIIVDPAGIIQFGSWLGPNEGIDVSKFQGHTGTMHIVTAWSDQDECVVGRPAPAKFQPPTAEESSADRTKA